MNRHHPLAIGWKKGLILIACGYFALCPADSSAWPLAVQTLPDGVSVVPTTEQISLANARLSSARTRRKLEEQYSAQPIDATYDHDQLFRVRFHDGVLI